MKKLLVIAIAILGFSLNGFCQLYIGGSASAMGGKSYVEASILPEVGFQITDKWAVGGQAGFTLNGYKDYDYMEAEASWNVGAFGVLAPFARFTVWDNQKVFVDLKAVASFEFADYLGSCQIGIVPAIRFRVGEKFDIAANLGLLGVKYGIAEYDLTARDLVNAMAFEGAFDWCGGFFAGSKNLSFSVYYLF